MNTCRDIREEKLKMRDALQEIERKGMSEKITEKVLQLNEIRRAYNVFVYVSFRSEVQTIPLIEKLLLQSKNVSVPKTYQKEKRVEAIRVREIPSDLVPGYYGILEPNEELCKTARVNPEMIDVVVVPGSVFDQRGGRFGYGGGFYDRFLEKLPDVVRIGLSFEMQLEKEIPLQKHDELLDYIVTEERVIQIKR